MTILILGAGGFGREVHDILAASEADDDVVFIDDGQPDPSLLAARGVALGGSSDDLSRYDGCDYVVAVGSYAARRALVQKAAAAGLKPRSVFHPTATLGECNEIGDGLIMCAHSAVTTNVRLGGHVHLNLCTTVGHDAVLGDYVTVNPGANISGGVVLGEGVTVGTGASIIQGVKVGARTVVGAGAVVVRDLPEDVTAVGAPAKPLAPR